MNPRLPTSRKWTALPGELVTQIIQILTETFPEQAKTGQMMAEGRIYGQELLLRLGFLETGRLAQANFEVSIEYRPKKDNVLTLIYLAVDSAASMMAEFFERDEDVDFPRLWKEFEVEGRKIYVQFTRVNTTLEAEADKILGIAGEDHLVQENEPQDGEEIQDLEELKASLKSKLGLDD